MRYGLRLLFDPDPPKELKNLAVNFFGNACAYCGETREKLHLDHLIASSNRLGHNGIANRVPACPKCNANQKREMPWRDFLSMRWRDDPAQIAPFAKKIEIWTKYVGEEFPGPPEPLLDLLEQEFARVKTEYEVSVRRIREATVRSTSA
jgi:hypothetical protein